MASDDLRPGLGVYRGEEEDGRVGVVRVERVVAVEAGSCVWGRCWGTTSLNKSSIHALPAVDNTGVVDMGRSGTPPRSTVPSQSVLTGVP